MTTFTPNQQQVKPKLVYFEDSAAEHIPGHATTKKIESLKAEIITLLNRMGAQMVVITEGTFEGNPRRDGYEVTFVLGKSPARLHCAALPIRRVTTTRKQQALRQALFLLRDWLQSSILFNLNQPPADVLVPFMLDNQGRTVAEALLGESGVRMLPAPRFK